MPITRDDKWKRILANAPRDVLFNLARKTPGHSPSELTKDLEALLDEIYRVCDSNTIQTLYEEFPGPHNFSTWFYRPASSLKKVEVQAGIRKNISSELIRGRSPKVTENPEVYKAESTSSTFMLRYAAADKNQRLALAFGETEVVHLVSYYESLLHFSDVQCLVFGATGGHKAGQIISETDSILELNGHWTLLKPERGKSREFYERVKAAISGYLIETKRHDPSGNYKTITLEARSQHPDLEKLPHFQRHYLHADSYYDVLQYTCKNKLTLSETTHVRFGRPFGRFIFKPGTSLSAILYFQGKVNAILR